MGIKKYLPHLPPQVTRSATCNRFGWSKPKIIPDVVLIFFVCNYPSTDRTHKFFIEANEANWENIKQIAGIRRANKEARLFSYIPFAEKASATLQEIEEKLLEENNLIGWDVVSKRPIKLLIL